jgi:hypothetical protein
VQNVNARKDRHQLGTAHRGLFTLVYELSLEKIEFNVVVAEWRELLTRCVDYCEIITLNSDIRVVKT